VFNSENIVPVLLQVYVALNLARVLESNETSMAMKAGNQEVQDIHKKNGKISCCDSKVRY